MILVSATRRVNNCEMVGCRLTVDEQILSITCDNASNNDTMITELANLLNDFPGPANQT